MLENKMIAGIHYSRFIASWVNVGGNFKRKAVYDENGEIEDVFCPFVEWLKSIEFEDRDRITDIEVKEILDFLQLGKLELEISAREYLKNNCE